MAGLFVVNNYRQFDNNYCSHYSVLLMINNYRQFDNKYLFSLFGSFNGQQLSTI